jgi:anaerobic ribonucleoside-triphosphate reductase
MIKEIEKRDGTIVPFNQEKITQAIFKAEKAVAERDKREPDYSMAQGESAKVVGKLEAVIANGVRPKVELIQDLAENQLMNDGYIELAKAYIRYRDQHKRLRDLKTLLNIGIIEDYLGENDWMVRENSNMLYSLQGLNNFISTKIVSGYWLNEIYPQEICETHKNGEFHIHDLGTLGAYCVGWDLEDLLRTGFKGVPGKIESTPPKHLDTVVQQIINFFYTLQGESAGAQAFSNFDTLLAPFVRKDNLSYEQVKQEMQKFLFGMNISTRVGFQTPFTNITLDLEVPNYMKNKAVIVGEEVKESTYGEFQKEMDMINEAFAECMLEGDATGRVFTFPIPTYNITKDFDWDNSKHDLLWEMTAKYGVPYFSNFINSDMKPEDARSMCCRLRLDQKELRKRGGGLFGANPLTGSIGVVTINMPRLGYISSNEKDFFGGLERLMELSKESLEIKRKALERLTDKGLHPYSKFYLRSVKQRFNEYWKNHFSTIGLLGMNEAIMNLMPGENIATERGREFTLKVLDFMRERIKRYQEETGNMYNLEATPGEGSTYRFAKKDKETFPEIIVANEEAVRGRAKPFYTNSTHLPVSHTDDLFGALKLQDALQVKYTGGTVFHAFIGERLKGEQVKRLVRKITESFHLPYFTITPTFSICPTHKYIAGDHEYCPKCETEGEQTKCERWSRSVGYLRPLQDWNEGKQSEWNEREMFKVS